MRTLIALSTASVAAGLLGCSGSSGPQTPNDPAGPIAEVTIVNVSPFDLVELSIDENSFGTLPARSSSPLIPLGVATRQAVVKAMVDGAELRFDPPTVSDDERYVQPGRFIYEIDVETVAGTRLLTLELQPESDPAIDLTPELPVPIALYNASPEWLDDLRIGQHGIGTLGPGEQTDTILSSLAYVTTTVTMTVDGDTMTVVPPQFTGFMPMHPGSYLYVLQIDNSSGERRASIRVLEN